VVGIGTVINMVAILLGSIAGVLVGHRMPERMRDLVTTVLGLVVLVIAAANIIAFTSAPLAADVGEAAPLLIVLGALLIGGILGSGLHIERRLESIGGWAQTRFSRSEGESGRARFVEGFVDASLLFCIGPLAILGAISDGLGNGIEQLVLKSILDGFAALAFAASLGWGVALSAVSVGLVQGIFTVLGLFAGEVLPDSYIDAVTATGGVLLLGVGIRLLKIKAIPVADLLPALVVAPVLVWVVSRFM
jgi:uncharacterized membrane protein YqgA involved in biofilm formation